MIPPWVTNLEQYVLWIDSVVDFAGSLGGELQEPDHLPISEDPILGQAAGVGDVYEIFVGPARIVFPSGAFLEFDAKVQHLDYFDERPDEVSEAGYSYHVATPGKFRWRYDRHDDHHQLGTEYHVHRGHGPAGERVTVHPSGEVALDDVIEEMQAEGLF